MPVLFKKSIEVSNIETAVKALVEQHFNAMESMEQEVTNMHSLVFDEVKSSLLKEVMQRCKYNQSSAANILGLSIGTTRTMLAKYFGGQYFRSTNDEQGV